MSKVYINEEDNDEKDKEFLQETASTKRLSLDESLKEEDDNSSNKRSSSTSITKSIVNRALDSNVSIAFMSFVTTYAIYGDDVRILAFNPQSDSTFLVLSSLAFMFFLFEITLLCWCRSNYLIKPNFTAIQEQLTLDRWKGRQSTVGWLGQLGKGMQMVSFYFWLDLISTLSMIIDMPWFIQLQMGSVGNVGNVDGSLAGKASMAGADAANKLKVIRMVRLVRLAKLYKYFSTKQRASSANKITPKQPKTVIVFVRVTKRVV